MRTGLHELPSPHPIAGTLPGIYQGPGFVERFCCALDDVLAPVLSTLDNLPAYLDVSTTPADLLPWLAYWIGMPVAPGQSGGSQREVLHAATQVHGWQGTPRGVQLAITAILGVRAVVEETGGADWSLDADAPLPGESQQAMVVRVFVPAGRTVDETQLDILVTSLKPAHVAHRVEVRAED